MASGRSATSTSDGAPVSERPAPGSRTLIIVPKLPAPGRDERIAAGEEPRVEYLELAKRLHADLLDYRAVAAAPSRLVRWLARWLGQRVGLAALAFARRNDYDQLYATGEESTGQVRLRAGRLGLTSGAVKG